MIQINPLQSYIDGGARAAITSPPSASLVFDLPGKAIWVKGVKLKGIDHTYTFSHDNYITLTNTPDRNNPESEDIKIGVNITALKNVIDTTYSVVTASSDGLAPAFSNGNKATTSANTTYHFLGLAGTTLKWYELPHRNIYVETTEVQSVSNTDPLKFAAGDGIEITWDSTNKKIVITNSSPDVNHNTDNKVAQASTSTNYDYPIILKGTNNLNENITNVNFSQYLTFNPNTKILKINSSLVVTMADIYVGATSEANATAGLVPAATSAQRNYFLKGDGTWENMPTATWRPIKVNSSEKLGNGADTGAIDFVAGTGITLGWDATSSKIIITNSAPDLNHNTHYTTSLYIGKNNDTKANAAVGNPYLKLFDDNTRRSTLRFVAGNGITVASDANGNITITNSKPDVNHNTNTWRPIKVGGSEKLGSGIDTGAVDFVAGAGIQLVWDATNKKITIINSAPDQNHNTDRTGIIKSTVSGTKKTDTTLIVANSSSGLIFEGGTNLFKIGDGTNYVEIPVTPSFTVTNKSASILSSLTTLATIAGTDIKAKVVVDNKAATLTTTAQTIATIAGVNITAKITNYNTDENVKQVDNNNDELRPILTKNGTGTGTIISSTTFADGVKINMKYNYIQAASYYTTSDRLKKQNISSFSEHIYKFQMRNTEKWYYGVIAQEVPEMFREGKEGNMTVNYNSVLSYYIGLLELKVLKLEDKLKKYEEMLIKKD